LKFNDGTINNKGSMPILFRDVSGVVWILKGPPPPPRGLKKN